MLGDVSTKLDGSLRIQWQACPAHGGLHLAKPRLRYVINSLTFIVTRTIRHKAEENEVFSPYPLFRIKPVRLKEDWRKLTQLNIL